MSDLSALLSELRCSDVRTHLQSGNASFTSKSILGLEGKIESAIERRFGFRPDVHVRTLEDLKSIIESNPFVDEAIDHPGHLVVFFHRHPPDPEDVAKVQSHVAGPERLGLSHGHLIVDYPEGIGTSKADRTPGWKQLVAAGTGRNWSTLVKLSLVD
jgi:uncharacterized protein (DUF1697 family)